MSHTLQMAGGACRRRVRSWFACQTRGLKEMELRHPVLCDKAIVALRKYWERSLTGFQNKVCILNRVTGSNDPDGIRHSFLEVDVRLELDFYAL